MGRELKGWWPSVDAKAAARKWGSRAPRGPGEKGKPGIRGEGAGLPTDSWIGSELAIDSV